MWDFSLHGKPIFFLVSFIKDKVQYSSNNYRIHKIQACLISFLGENCNSPIDFNGQDKEYGQPMILNFRCSQVRIGMNILPREHFRKSVHSPSSIPRYPLRRLFSVRRYQCNCVQSVTLISSDRKKSSKRVIIGSYANKLYHYI